MLAAGEFESVERVVARQSRDDMPVFFGRAYSDPTAYYKLVSVRERRPALLVLGTSRVLAIRSIAFRPEARFFNAGNGVTRLRHFKAFLERVPAGQEPRLILLGLDQYLFNERFDDLRDDGFEKQWQSDIDVSEMFFSSWKTVYADLAGHKFSLQQLAAPASEQRIGVNARVHRNAFRNDGSYTWARYAADPTNPDHEDHAFRNTLDRIAKGNRRFEYGAHASPAAVRAVDALLQACKARGIHVVAFLPPFAHQVLMAMRARPRDYGYLSEVAPALRPVFETHGFVLEDFSDLADLGASDRETIDGFHGSEKAYLRLVMRLVERDAKLSAFARDRAWLQERLMKTPGDQLVFNHDER